MTAFATVQDMQNLWRAMTLAEQQRAEELLEVVSDRIRQEGELAGKDVDRMAFESTVYASALRSVTVDVTARAMATPTDDVPMSQMSQSALGYTVSGTYLIPGGGIFIKKDELRLLGIRRQKAGLILHDFD